MKLIIIEGQDRVGKNSLINRLLQDEDNAIIRHWGLPEGNTNDEILTFSKAFFNHEFQFYDTVKNDPFIKGNMFWNRAHLGEFVFGAIYRNSNPETWVWDLEKKWGFDSDEVEIYLILLEADPKFITAKDDGKSHSNDLENKILEAAAFEKAFDDSTIKKKFKIKINDGDNYINKDIIYHHVKYFIDNKFTNL